MAYACVFVYSVCVPVLGRPEYAANPNQIHSGLQVFPHKRVGAWEEH